MSDTGVGLGGRVSGLLPPIEPLAGTNSPSPPSPSHHDPADERPLPTLANKKSVPATYVLPLVLC